MPRTLTATIDAYAHCPDPRCPGYSQQPVKAVQSTVEHTYVDSGGDMPGVEKSQVYLAFEEQTDETCPDCGRQREVTDQKRKTYGALSGHDPNGLLQIKPPELAA